jgi:ATP-dependent Clp protease adaptor protein ClpS
MSDTGILDKVESVTQIQEPKLYKVLLHNDDSTTFDFVIMVLVQIFHRNVEDAIEITKAIHVEGQGIAGSPYTREIAEEKALETLMFSRANGFPLTATFEEL